MAASEIGPYMWVQRNEFIFSFILIITLFYQGLYIDSMTEFKRQPFQHTQCPNSLLQVDYFSGLI